MDLPLFPLRTVLFPESRLELRIFEARYLDMVRDCMRAGAAFGVCMIDPESGLSNPSSTGTEAIISDFNALPDGLLGISITGKRCFNVLSSHQKSDGLIIGNVKWREAQGKVELPTEHALLATLLHRLADHRDSELVSAEKARFDEAAWVGFRLADRMPLPLSERQLLLEMDDAVERLDQIGRWLPRFQQE